MADDTTDATDAAAPAQPAAPAFRLLARGFCLRRKPQTEPTLKAIYGDVALCDGRTIARYRTAGYGGDVLHAVELPALDRIPDDDPMVDRDLLGGAAGTDWAGDIRRTLSLVDNQGQYFQLAPAPESDEQRFAREWPVQSRILGYVAPDPPRRLFPLGSTYHPKKWLAQGVGIDQDYLREVLAQHVAGDWGAYGYHAVEPLSAAERWMLPMLSVETQSREAARAMTGAVRSRHAVRSDLAARLQRRRPAWQTASFAIDVTTAFAGGPITLMYLCAE